MSKQVDQFEVRRSFGQNTERIAERTAQERIALLGGCRIEQIDHNFTSDATISSKNVFRQSNTMSY